jgi:hypothetical protein
MAEPFATPVPLAAFPDYLKYVETPCDLGTVQQRLEGGKYKEPEAMQRDVRLVNAREDSRPRGVCKENTPISSFFFSFIVVSRASVVLHYYYFIFFKGTFTHTRA